MISIGSDINRQVVDTAALDRLRRLGGNELVHKMIELFISHVEPLISQASKSFQAGEFEAVERAAHSVKSSAANVGASDLRSIAERIEEIAPAGDRLLIGGLLANLEEAFAAAKARLEKERV